MKHNHFHARLYRTPETGMVQDADWDRIWPYYETALSTGLIRYTASGSTTSEGQWVGASGNYDVTWLSAPDPYHKSMSPFPVGGDT